MGDSVAATGTRPPNFVLVVCDDLGYGDIEPFGGTIPTPALKRMAREGLSATDFYAPANLCTASRAGFLTGRYPVRTGLAYEVILEGDDRTLPLTERTLAHALGPAGYACGMFGKWHLGHMGPSWLPTNYGFDRFTGIPYSHDMSPVHLFEADVATQSVTETPAELPNLQQEFYAAAERFIDDNRERPFLAVLALSAPHLPNYPPAQFHGGSDAGLYGDVVREIDSIVGRLLDHLAELGLEDNTFVVFTSDNGPWYEGSSAALRGRKGDTAYDGGYRVPFVAWAPGRIAAGSSTAAIISGMDMLPTLCALAGVAPPAGVTIDGRDISGVLLDGMDSPHDAILLFNNEDVVGIRTQRWKYVSHTYYRGLWVNMERQGYPQLYDMSRDAPENYSVADRHPDILADMQTRVRDARETFAPYKKGMPPFIRELINTGRFRAQD